ncbi:MAG: hypothetical protein BWY54_00420 [Candidatus Dependentiae bacterium ADurb.Bin331]|nr:MAG: hypothetical protein BWY54_00420 [Candidatus Dependentiae bacterium ADurb.Bin331]
MKRLLLFFAILVGANAAQAGVVSTITEWAKNNPVPTLAAGLAAVGIIGYYAYQHKQAKINAQTKAQFHQSLNSMKNIEKIEPIEKTTYLFFKNAQEYLSSFFRK